MSVTEKGDPRDGADALRETALPPRASVGKRHHRRTLTGRYRNSLSLALVPGFGRLLGSPLQSVRCYPSKG